MLFPKASEPCAHCFDENALRIPGHSDSVHKDDCAYCGHTNHHGIGILVCLACFTGVCPTHLSKHLSLKKGHTMYVLVRQLPRSEPEAITDVNQLGVVAPSEFELQLVCGECRQSYEPGAGLSDESFQQTIMASSTAMEDAITADINNSEHCKPICPHLQALVQSSPVQLPPIAPTSETKCARHGCNVCTNNWMCLTCGAVGCPRQEAGGQEHAVLHGLETGHPAVLKIGTVTPKGADVYCYHCDNNVRDLNLQEHLHHFGIDMSHAVKTAKTVGEMEYDWNSQYNFNIITESGKDLIPVYGPGNTGLHNFGNTCYISSILQCLAVLRPFQKAYYNPIAQVKGAETPHQVKCSKNPYKCHSCQLERIISGLLSGKFSVPGVEAKLNGLTPREFKRVFANNHPEFSTGEQQDAPEYFTFLINELQTRVPKSFMNPQPPAGVIHPAKIFDMLLQERVECKSCHKVRYNKVLANSLPIAIPIETLENNLSVTHSTLEEAAAQRPKKPFLQCLEAFFMPTEIPCKCDECGARTSYSSVTSLATFPDVLLLNLRRAYFDKQTCTVKKLEVDMEQVPLEIDLSQHRGKGLQPQEIPMKDTLAEAPKRTVAESVQVKAPSDVNDVALAQMLSLGIEEATCRWALHENHNDVERSIDFVFSHPEGPPSIETEDAQVLMGNIPTSTGEPHVTDGSAKYRLRAIVSHMGSSAKTGHYVCHIREPTRWIIFNDEKVAISQEPPLKLASMYFYERQE